MGYATLKLEFEHLSSSGVEGELATITLNRPEKRNAISTEMIEDLLAAPD